MNMQMVNGSEPSLAITFPTMIFMLNLLGSNFESEYEITRSVEKTHYVFGYSKRNRARLEEPPNKMYTE